MSLTLPSDRIDPICNNLDSGAGERQAAKIIAGIIKMDPRLTGRSPTCVAAACIYVAAHAVTYAEGSRLSQGKIAEAADVNEASIHTIYPIVADAAGVELTAGSLRVNRGDGR